MRVTVPSLAKLNLDLRVLHKRLDGFHELRTIFQTISLHDSLTIEVDFAKRTQIDLASSIDIPDNLVVRSAKLILDHLKVKAWVRFSLSKRIPMGAGLGGGSSNAATVLIALPALVGRKLPIVDQLRLAESIGSDVPFFLHGGTALGLGRGTELYPLPQAPFRHALVISSGVHVSTASAYTSLRRNVTNPLTSAADSPILGEFQTIAWAFADSGPGQFPLKNDFETAVFAAHPELLASVRKLRREGASMAMLTGSGSAVFGIFESSAKCQKAALSFASKTAFPVRFVSRTQYRRQWRKALGAAAAASCFAHQEES